jgi:hypothetical protein
MTPHDSAVITAAIPERIDSPEKFSVYCSATEIFLSGWDVRINLMENIPPMGGRPTALVHGSVVMSPVHAKAFQQALKKAIDQYEEKFGELDVQRVLDAQNALTAMAVSPTE